MCGGLRFRREYKRFERRGGALQPSQSHSTTIFVLYCTSYSYKVTQLLLRSSPHNIDYSFRPCAFQSSCQDASRRQQRMCSAAKPPYLAACSIDVLTAIQQGQDVYIRTNDSNGERQQYRVETREVGWYCYYCHYGPMSPELYDHCIDCHRRRSKYSHVETARFYYPVQSA